MKLAKIESTMTSLEIAALTEKHHSHVLRDIREMLDQLKITASSFGASYKDSSGKKNACFNLQKRETLILVSGYSVAMRAKIIDRWQELESAQSLRIASRQATKEECPALTNAIKVNREMQGKEVKPHLFSNEFNMINRIALGMTAKEYRIEHNLPEGAPIRDHITTLELRCVEHLQRVAGALVDTGDDYESRKEKLTKIFNSQHKQKLIDEILRIES